MSILEISPAALARLCLAAFVQGALVALIYEIFAVLLNIKRICARQGLASFCESVSVAEYGRKGKMPFAVARGVCDALLTVISAVTLLFVNFLFNDGEFRLFTILLSAIGFFAVHKSVGRVLRGVLVFSIFILKKLLQALFAPLKRFASSRIKLLRARLVAARRRRRIKVYTKNLMKAADAAVQNGMPP